MTLAALISGCKALFGRPGLMVIIYGVGAGVALLVSVPFTMSLQDATGPYGNTMASGFDLGLWYEVFLETRSELLSVALNLLWVVPLYLIWDAASSVGLCYTLSNGGGFWRGAGRYAGISLLIGLVYLPLLVAALVLIAAIVLGMAALIPPGDTQFYLRTVGLPIGLILSVLLVNLMRDASRAAYVVQRAGLGRALRAGLTAWAMIWAYFLWTALAIGILAATIVLESSLAAGTFKSAVVLTVGLQFLMVLRAAVRVAWHGSLVTLTPERFPLEGG